MVGRRILGIVFVVLLGTLSGFVGPARAQQGVSCNPDIRAGNSACSQGELCRRLGGDCDGLNAICIDRANSETATALGAFFCAAICRNSRGLCENEVARCNFDSDCVRGLEKCEGGVCTYQAGTCRANADCNPGQSCESGKCRAVKPPSPPPPQGCTSSAQCLPTQQCVYGTCRPATCKSNSQCAPGQVCKSGRCLGVPGGGCTSSSQCHSDEVCYQSRCVKP
jgi:hypothetical protein